jgi:hypothetical protein
MRFYHGSDTIFKEFDKNSIGRNFMESERSGFFFTVNKSAAENFPTDILHTKGSSFVFEVDLALNNPVERTAPGFYSPADYFDRNPDDFLNEAYIEKRDGLFIRGNGINDIAVVFEPEQIEILKIYEDGVVVFDRDAPEDTRYPEIMGAHVMSNVNEGVKPFLYNRFDELEHKVSSAEFGEYADDDVREGLRGAPVYHSNDGRHFGVGEDFAKMAFSMMCNGGLGNDDIQQCRQDCLVIHDFDENITLIKDFRQDNESLEEILKRPLVEVAGVVKSFSPKDPAFYDKHRPLSHAIGPEDIIDKYIENIPDYMTDLVSLCYAKNDSTPIVSEKNVSEAATPSEAMVRRL